MLGKNLNNWISATGGVLAVGALFSFALLVWIDFTHGDKNPYLGILTYLVAPGFLMAGLVTVFSAPGRNAVGRSSMRQPCRTNGG